MIRWGDGTETHGAAHATTLGGLRWSRAIHDATPGARWALKQTGIGFLARWWGIHKSGASRKVSEGRNALAEVCALVEQPDVNGEAIVAEVLESLERKYLREAMEDRKACEARLAHLLSKEHDAEANQNRALQRKVDVEDACLAHVAVLLEIVGRSRALSMTEDR